MSNLFILTVITYSVHGIVPAETNNRPLNRDLNIDSQDIAEILLKTIGAERYNDIQEKRYSQNTDFLRQIQMPVPRRYNNTAKKSPFTSLPFVVSDSCRNQTAGVTRGLSNGDLWALKMLDAAGKPPSNILGGAMLWIGDYDECLSIQGSYNISRDNYTFDTQFCMLTIRSMRSKLMISVGVCLPDGCSNTDISNLLNPVLMTISNGSWVVVNVMCQEPNRPFDTRAIIVLVVVSLFAAIMVMATLYDVIMIQLPKWQKEEHGKLIDEKSLLINTDKPEEYKPGLAGQLFLSFSIYTNGSKILSTRQGDGCLTAVNGIRFITMTWIILAHTCKAAAQNFKLDILDNVAQWVPDSLKRIPLAVIYNGFPAVDTFFTLSGLLLTYLVLKELKKNEGKMNWPIYYFHRFWRLTPPYMLILMVYVSLFPYIGQGPLWLKEGIEVNYCEHSWFRNFLYVNNLFVDGYDICMQWTWYLANDMQFFIISPLIILPLFHYHLIGVTILLILLLATMISCGVSSVRYDLPVALMDWYDEKDIHRHVIYNNEYVKPWNRIGPYLIGMYAGYILYRTECKFRINRNPDATMPQFYRRHHELVDRFQYVSCAAWLFFTALACTIVYGIHEDMIGNRSSKEVAALYNSTNRIVWAVCIVWVIFACATGNGGFINTFLSWKVFVPLSRLTYCAYLVHPIVITYYLLRRHKLIHFSDTEITYEFIGHAVLSYAVAFVASLAFESPMMRLEKVILQRSEEKNNG